MKMTVKKVFKGRHGEMAVDLQAQTILDVAAATFPNGYIDITMLLILTLL